MAQQHCEVSRWQQLKSQLNNLTPAQFLERFQQTPDAILVDVRTKAEYDSYHLPGAVHLDYLGPDFLDQMEEMNTQTHYFIYCRSSRRSVRACTLMRNGGFANLYNMDGGLAQFGEDGLVLP